MKKRLLALALCLVMMTSLLPLTAAAGAPTYHVKSVEIEADGVYQGTDGLYHLNITDWKIVCDEGTIDINDENTVTRSDFSTVDCQKPDNPSEEGAQYLAVFVIGFNSLHLGRFVWNYNEIPSCTLRIPGYESVLGESSFIGTENNDTISAGFILTKEHDHDWQFTQTDSTLTATCQKSTCPTKEVSVTLKADSVTLPTSPFNARLEGWEQFHDAIPTARYEKLVYKYNGPNGWTEVEPIAANAKAGEYQVGVRILGLPDKENGTVAMSLADGANADAAGYADLYVRYTAADPKVTAQTGDNRPIEIMMAGILVFSALAAAAFIVDSKRKNASL